MLRRLLTRDERKSLDKPAKRALRQARLAERQAERAEDRAERLEDDKINTWTEFWGWTLARMGGALRELDLKGAAKAEAREVIEDWLEVTGTEPSRDQVIQEVAEELGPRLDEFITYPAALKAFGVTLEAVDDAAWPVVVKILIRPIIAELYDEA